MTLETGKILNNLYRVVKLLGSGSMGNVYLVERIQDDKQFVVKELILTEVTGLNTITAREIFLKEADFMKKFDHPGLPRMYETFNQDGRDYLVMDYIEGKTLEEIINNSEGPVPEKKAIKWIIEVSEIIDYLHNSFHTPVVYRDLKPSNIIITPEDKPKLVDFGIARYYNPDKDSDTFNYGSPGYAAPEQYRGRGQTSPQTDVFGLGVILYQMLTKYDPTLKPFVFPPLKKLNPSVPEKLISIVSRAIELNPLKRYISMSEFRESLEKYLAVSAGNSSEKKPSEPYKGIYRVLLTNFLIPIILIVIFIIITVFSMCGWSYLWSHSLDPPISTIIIRLFLLVTVVYLIFYALFSIIYSSYRYTAASKGIYRVLLTNFLIPVILIVILISIFYCLHYQWSPISTIIIRAFSVTPPVYLIFYTLLLIVNHLYRNTDSSKNMSRLLFNNFFIPIILIIFLLTIISLVYRPLTAVFPNIVTGFLVVPPLYLIFYDLLFVIFSLYRYIKFRTTERSHKVNYLFINMVSTILTFFLIFIYLPSFYEYYFCADLSACESNLKNMATSLEMYATDNNGNYPPSVKYLTTVNSDGVPYIKKIPVCPSPVSPFWQQVSPEVFRAWQKLLPESFHKESEGTPYEYVVSINPDNFTLWCKTPKGHIEAGVTNAGYPQYSPGGGLPY